MLQFLQSAWFFFMVGMDVMLVHIMSVPAFFSEMYFLIFPRPRKNIRGQTVLITGSGQGLGRELALLFARQQCDVICVDINEEQNEATAMEVRDLGAKCRAFVCDVADRSAVFQLAKTVGKVDILVNNAGMIALNNIWTMNEEEIRTLTNINFLSHFWTIQAFVPAMKERDHGHVVCISSLSGLAGWSHVAPYAATKFGIAGLMKSLSLEMRKEKKNVKITTVFPYVMQTRPDLIQYVKARMPMLNVKDAAKDIVNGIRQNLTSFCVPRFYKNIVTCLNLYPESFEDRWYRKFYVDVDEESLLKQKAANGVKKPRKSVTISSVEVC